MLGPDDTPESDIARNAAFAPETHNAEQDDESSQAHTLADEALGRRAIRRGAWPLGARARRLSLCASALGAAQ